MYALEYTIQYIRVFYGDRHIVSSYSYKLCVSQNSINYCDTMEEDRRIIGGARFLVGNQVWGAKGPIDGLCNVSHMSYCNYTNHHASYMYLKRNEGLVSIFMVQGITQVVSTVELDDSIDIINFSSGCCSSVSKFIINLGNRIIALTNSHFIEYHEFIKISDCNLRGSEDKMDENSQVKYSFNECNNDVVVLKIDDLYYSPSSNNLLRLLEQCYLYQTMYPMLIMGYEENSKYLEELNKSISHRLIYPNISGFLLHYDDHTLVIRTHQRSIFKLLDGFTIHDVSRYSEFTYLIEDGVMYYDMIVVLNNGLVSRYLFDSENHISTTPIEVAADEIKFTDHFKK